MDEMILAKMVAGLPGIAIAVGQAALPEEIQWMPPGEHEITATGADGKAIKRKVRVTSVAARRMEELLQGLRSKAAHGVEDRPYVDFNHDDAEAAGHVVGFSWGGDDPVEGGIRAKVEWTGPGRRALEEKAYRRFSPSFYVDTQGEVTGAPLNMGGLVNRAAFKGIAPIWSKEAMADGKWQMAENLKQKTMTEQNELADLKTALAARDAEIAQLKAKNAELGNKVVLQAKASAEAVVDQAVKDGRLAKGNMELRAKWVNLIAADPANAELLTAMPSREDQETQRPGDRETGRQQPMHMRAKAKAPASAGIGGEGADGASGPEDEEARVREANALIEEKRLERKCSYEQARNLVRAKRPELFGLK